MSLWIRLRNHTYSTHIECTWHTKHRPSMVIVRSLLDSKFYIGMCGWWTCKEQLFREARNDGL